jgi:hypothetical protein
MDFRCWRDLTLLALVTFAMTGCDRGQELAATEVLNNTNCKGAEDGLTKVSYAEVAELRGSTLISMSNSSEATTSGNAAGDNASEDLLLFALSKGRQPTPGYFFSLTDARLKDQRAILELTWHSPGPDSVQAQVITYPCIVVAVEPGNYREVRAVDQNQELLGEIRI